MKDKTDQGDVTLIAPPDSDGLDDDLKQNKETRLPNNEEKIPNSL